MTRPARRRAPLPPGVLGGRSAGPPCRAGGGRRRCTGSGPIQLPAQEGGLGRVAGVGAVEHHDPSGAGAEGVPAPGRAEDRRGVAARDVVVAPGGAPADPERPQAALGPPVVVRRRHAVGPVEVVARRQHERERRAARLGIRRRRRRAEPPYPQSPLTANRTDGAGAACGRRAGGRRRAASGALTSPRAIIPRAGLLPVALDLLAQGVGAGAQALAGGVEGFARVLGRRGAGRGRRGPASSAGTSGGGAGGRPAPADAAAPARAPPWRPRPRSTTPPRAPTSPWPLPPLAPAACAGI